MDNQTGDRCTFRDVTGEHKLTGVSNDGIVQYEVDGTIYTTDESEITRNYNAASRDRAKRFGMSEEEQAAIDSMAESLLLGLEQSANGDTASLGSFAKYIPDDKMPPPRLG
jgi:hypothetical protein